MPLFIAAPVRLRIPRPLASFRAVSAAFDFRPVKCPTCAVDDTEVLGYRGGASHRTGAGERCRVVRCKSCDLIYANPFPFPKDVDALYSDTEDFFALHPDPEHGVVAREPLIQQVEKLTSGRRLLDVGAGRGELVAAALRRGWDAYGVESAKKFVDAAEKHCPGRIFHGFVEDVSIEALKGPFDAVILAAVLEHLHTPNTVLGAISRLLKPGGVLYVDVPNDAGLYFRLGNLWNRLRRRDQVVHLSPTFSPYHVYGFSRRSLTAMLRAHDLEPERFHFYTGESALPLRKSIPGVVEWLGSKAVHYASKGELATYLECFARKVDTRAS